MLRQAEATKHDAHRAHRSSTERAYSSVEGASDDGGPTDVEGASDGGYSAVDTVAGGPEWSTSPTMDGGGERSGDGTLSRLSWPTRWPGFGRLSSESGGDGLPATNGPSQMQNGHVQNGKPSSIEATARLASKGSQIFSQRKACLCALTCSLISMKKARRTEHWSIVVVCPATTSIQHVHASKRHSAIRLHRAELKPLLSLPHRRFARGVVWVRRCRSGSAAHHGARTEGGHGHDPRHLGARPDGRRRRRGRGRPVCGDARAVEAVCGGDRPPGCLHPRRRRVQLSACLNSACCCALLLICIHDIAWHAVLQLPVNRFNQSRHLMRVVALPLLWSFQWNHSTQHSPSTDCTSLQSWTSTGRWSDLRGAPVRRQAVLPPTALQPLPDPTWSSRAKSLLNSTTAMGSHQRGSRERERGQNWWTLQKETPWSHYKIGARGLLKCCAAHGRTSQPVAEPKNQGKQPAVLARVNGSDSCVHD